MNDDEQDLLTLEHALRSLAARDKQGAAEAATAMQERVQQVISAESARVERRQAVYQAVSLVASLVLLLGMGSLLFLNEDVQVALGLNIERSPVKGDTQTIVPQSVPEVAVCADSLDEGSKDELTVDSSAITYAPESVRMRGMGKSRSAVLNLESSPTPQVKAEGGAGELSRMVAQVMAQEPHPWMKLRSLFLQGGGNQTLVVKEGLTVSYADREVSVIVENASGQKMYHLQSPEDSLPEEVRKLFELTPAQP
ncbi:MAG: hypothetical protein II295_08765 [Akkermansia sp.]|nr:hypothetical protein [Akkermansia sp.]